MTDAEKVEAFCAIERQDVTDIRVHVRTAAQLIRLLVAKDAALEAWESDDGLAFALADVELKTFIRESL